MTAVVVGGWVVDEGVGLVTGAAVVEEAAGVVGVSSSLHETSEMANNGVTTAVSQRVLPHRRAGAASGAGVGAGAAGPEVDAISVCACG